MQGIDGILKMVEAAKQAGYEPSSILDEDELAIYEDNEAELKPDLSSHYANLALSLDSSYLSKLAQNVVDWVMYDENTRKEWLEREAEGVRMLGVSDKGLSKPAFEGGSQLTHPLLAEAMAQFHSRAISELFPPEGPVRTQVIGEKTAEKLAQAERVQDYMNYQYTEDMPGAFDEEDTLLYRLPLSGSVFKKIYYDPLLKKPVSRMIEPADFIVPYSATDLPSAGRFTHRYRKSHNWLMRNIQSGYFKKGRLFESSVNDMHGKTVVHDEIDLADGKQRAYLEDDSQHTIYEMCVYLSIPGHEDVDEMGEETGVGLPYKVWVDRDNLEVLRIERNWLAGDDEKNIVVDIVHKKFMPGLGFYGYGLLHLLAGLAKSASGSLNALLDSAAFANLQGGFRTRDSRVKGGDLNPIAPGEWREVDISAEELNKAFFRIPYDEPSPVLFQLLGYIDDRAQKFIGTTGIMTGDANPNAPVGTTLALIEQGAKTFGAIFRRLHVANRDEFRILARLNSMYIPEKGYPYEIASGSRVAFPFDFDGNVDILPVSDPNIFSNSQRIVMAQSVMQLAEKFPDKINVTEALRQMLEAMRAPHEKLLQVDGAMQEHQSKLMQIEIQIKQAELEKIQAERTEIALRGLFSATQIAGLIASNTAIVPIADQVYLSAGGVDMNGQPIAAVNGMANIASSAQLGIPANTSPMFPAKPEVPGVGVNSGIETAKNEQIAS